MCLILFAYDMHPKYQLALVANRDEYYTRPTQPLTFWDDGTGILAGRDLKNHGTWLGVTRTGRIAAITNYRDPKSLKENAPSRGLLVSSFLAGTASPPNFFQDLQKIGHKYNGFNLLAGDDSGLYYFSNRVNRIQRIEPGLYGLSNHLLDTPWPKVEKGKAAFKALLDAKTDINLEDLYNLLQDRSYPPDDRLPDTGVGLEAERLLAPLFIANSIYGTRSSSIVLMERTGTIMFTERTFINKNQEIAEDKTVQYGFKAVHTKKIG
jgi:uncharacterized protein with NRDE domain